jgi:hypothetical protein
MKVGDLVKMRNTNSFRSGVIVCFDDHPVRGHHTVRVHFIGHKIEKLNGLQWCNPKDLEVL